MSTNLLEKEVGVQYKAPLVFFHCMKCGFCCEHLIKDTQYGKMGIFLRPEETEWFPKEKIVPQYGVGEKGHSRPRPYNIFSYQLDAMVCTWLDRKQRTCMIRTSRPLACRAYPVTHGTIDLQCRFIRQYTSEENQKIEMNSSSIKEEVEADHEVVDYIKKSMEGQGTLWVFPLDKRKWEIVARRPIIKSTVQLPKFKVPPRLA